MEAELALPLTQQLVEAAKDTPNTLDTSDRKQRSDHLAFGAGFVATHEAFARGCENDIRGNVVARQPDRQPDRVDVGATKRLTAARAPHPIR